MLYRHETQYGDELIENHMTLNKSKCNSLRIKFRHPVKFLFHVGNINWINYCAGFAHDQNVAFSQRCVCGVTFILKALFSELLSDSRQLILSSALALENPMEQTVAKKKHIFVLHHKKNWQSRSERLQKCDSSKVHSVFSVKYVAVWQPLIVCLFAMLVLWETVGLLSHKFQHFPQLGFGEIFRLVGKEI